MIVEEAAEILEGQLVAAIPPSVQHLIMIGDHQQLRPVVQNCRLRKTYKLDVSMFERLVNCDVPLMQLGFQCRMRDDIVELLRTLDIYKDLKTRTEVKIHVCPNEGYSFSGKRCNVLFLLLCFFVFYATYNTAH